MSITTHRYICLLGLGLLPLAAIAQCDYEEGEARWAIKTSIVSPIKKPIVVELSELLDLENVAVDKSQKKGLETGRLPRQKGWKLKEGDIIRTTGVVDHVKCNKDGDFHVQLRVADDPKRCLIIEVIDPSQGGTNKRMVRLYDKVRLALDKKVLKGKKSYKPRSDDISVTVEGQFFYDADHFRKSNPGGGRGIGECKATNLWEIHPVTLLE